MPAGPHLLDGLVPIVRRAGELALQARSDSRRELKPDGSIVTPGDRQVEEFLRRELPGLLPGSTVYGEEFGHEGDSPQGLWVVDPIDGTSNYAFGSPLWGVSVGLVEEDEITAGAVFLPQLDEMYEGALGRGARCNGEPLPAIPPGPIRPEELVSFNDALIERYPGKSWPGKMRYSGAFVVDAMWVAQQRFRALLGIKGRLYDIAASARIVEELGAIVAYADGSPLLVADLKDGQRIPKAYAFLPRGAEPPLLSER